MFEGVVINVTCLTGFADLSFEASKSTFGLFRVGTCEFHVLYKAWGGFFAVFGPVAFKVPVALEELFFGGGFAGGFHFFKNDV